MALERIKQLNQEVAVLETILKSYLPVIEKDKHEKRWMVSVNKMVQPSYWFLQLILLCILGDNILACDREYQYSSIRFHQEDRGEVILFLLNVVLTKIGKELDKGYRCPVYCGVDHIHRRRCTYEEKVYYERVNELYRGIKRKNRKQTTSNIRSTGRIRIECTD